MNLPMIISTGLATIEEVDEAVLTCREVGNNQIALLHCVANYPTQPEETNLLAIKSLREKFSVPIGYSDNGESTLVDLVAVSIGSNLIEKHFTLDKKMQGPDHFFSIDPPSLSKLMLDIRLIEKIRGDGEKIPQPSEMDNILSIRKSITAAINIKKGEVLSIDNLLVKRPAKGIEPKFFQSVLGKITKRDIQKDENIQWTDIS